MLRRTALLAIPAAVAMALLASGYRWIIRVQLNEALSMAVLTGQTGRASQLLESGADANLVETKIGPGAQIRRQPLLFVALRNSHPQRLVMVRLLLPSGADPNAVTTSTEASFPEGQTPLMAAAEVGDIQLIRELLAHGADPRRGDSRGLTAEHYAVAVGNTAAALVLRQVREDERRRSLPGPP
jgi:ankyrin repeat protein